MAPKNVYPIITMDNDDDNNIRKCRRERLVHIHDNSHEEKGRQNYRWSNSIVTYVNHCQQQQYHRFHNHNDSTMQTVSTLSPVSSNSDRHDMITTITTNNSQSSNTNHIDTLIESRKTWPVGITTRSAIRMMRSCGYNKDHYIDHQQDSFKPKYCPTSELPIKEKKNSSRRKEKSQSSTKTSFQWSELIRPRVIHLRKLKSFRVLVFGSMNKNSITANSGGNYNYDGHRLDNNFLRKCRHNFIMEPNYQRKGSNSDLLSTYSINYACGLSNVCLELCFLKWSDSFQTKSEFYQQTFAPYFNMTNIAIGYYDPNDLESIEHMQSWIKAFYNHHHHHNKKSLINMVIIRIEDTSSSHFRRLLRKAKRLEQRSYDHIVSSLLNKFRTSIYHMTIKHRLFGRKPSLKPLWKVMYHVITMGRMMIKKHSMDEDSMIIDRIENVEKRLTRGHRQETLNKMIGRFIRNLTNGIWRFIQRPNHHHWF